MMISRYSELEVRNQELRKEIEGYRRIVNYFKEDIKNHTGERYTTKNARYIQMIFERVQSIWIEKSLIPPEIKCLARKVLETIHQDLPFQK